jgi:hypothetical protein
VRDIGVPLVSVTRVEPDPGFFLLITRQYPRGVFDLLIGINRWLYRVLPTSR